MVLISGYSGYSVGGEIVPFLGRFCPIFGSKLSLLELWLSAKWVGNVPSEGSKWDGSVPFTGVKWDAFVPSAESSHGSTTRIERPLRPLRRRTLMSPALSTSTSAERSRLLRVMRVVRLNCRADPCHPCLCRTNGRDRTPRAAWRACEGSVAAAMHHSRDTMMYPFMSGFSGGFDVNLDLQYSASQRNSGCSS